MSTHNFTNSILTYILRKYKGFDKKNGEPQLSVLANYLIKRNKYNDNKNENNYWQEKAQKKNSSIFLQNPNIFCLIIFVLTITIQSYKLSNLKQ